MSFRTIIFTFLLIGLTSFVGDCQDIKIHLIHIDSKEFCIDQITIKHKDETVALVMADKEGFVNISSTLRKDSTEYDLFLTSLGVKGTYLTTIDSKTSGLIEISLPKIYKMRFGKAVCPKCGRINNVYKAVYCEAPIVVMKIVKEDTIYSPIYKGRYYMTSDVTNNLDPKWYCKEDDILY
jgi:hypothetical protein